jgi:alkaline phosphatase
MKSKSLIIVLLGFVIIISTSSGTLNSGKKERSKPIGIVLFIGDGMGVSQLYAGMTASRQTLNLEHFPYSGFSKTYSFDNYITDSAAGGTAIACGVKTRNGMIGMGPDSTIVRSIMEVAHENGFATGLVSTSAITHATPASFVSHNSGRGNYEDIAKDFLKGTIDVFIGGGEDHFRRRQDSVDLCSVLIEKGYDVVYTVDDLSKSNSDKLVGLLAKVHLPTVREGRIGLLKTMTEKAIETLSRNKKGFVLMVEGSMIDWGGHAKNLDYLISEMIDMDDAIGKALEFADKNKNTLIVVTADHETGGLSLIGGNINRHEVTGNFSGSDHTAVMVPVFSIGPGAERFSGIHDNTFFFNEFLNVLKISK